MNLPKPIYTKYSSAIVNSLTYSSTVPISYMYNTSATTSATQWDYIDATQMNSILVPDLLGKITIQEGRELTIELPNGAKLSVHADGSYDVNDDGKVIYKGCKVKEFNRFINASDLIEDFIRFMGSQFNVRQGEILDIPIDLFVTWLIMKACQQDGDEVPFDVPKIENHSFIKGTPTLDRCKWCGRFISKKRIINGIMFCNPYCMDKFTAKVGIL